MHRVPKQASQEPENSPAQLEHDFEPISFEDMEGWRSDDHEAALSCFRVTARRLSLQPYPTGRLGVTSAALAWTAKAIAESGLSARQSFEACFTPYRLLTSRKRGYVTGYFEPEIDASPIRTGEFTYPLYRRPDDLVEIDETNRPQDWDPGIHFGRESGSGVKLYPDRAAIDAGALAGKNLEIAWLRDAVEAFFVHVQGSARLIMTNGETWRVGYAGKSGHAYSSIGRLLIEAGEIPKSEMSMVTLREWLKMDHSRAAHWMARNRSYIFFSRLQDANPDLGPVGAAGVALTAGRSLATDHRIHTYGTPVWIATKRSLPHEADPFRRLLIAQDTGSAITGPGRGDLFIGSGREAGELAGSISHECDFIVFMPRKTP